VGGYLVGSQTLSGFKKSGGGKMNKSGFYGIAITLVLTSFICLIVSNMQARPTEFFGILIVVLVIDSILFATEVGLNFWYILFILPILAGVILLVGPTVATIDGSIADPAANENFNAICILGFRWVSFLWPLAVLVSGTYKHYRKYQEEAKAKEEKV
jgi:hypothetical protein